MKPGLTLQKFYPTDAINSEKIDGHLTTIAKQINGGLTAANIASTYKLSVGQFAEKYSLFTIGAEANGQASGTYIVAGALQGSCFLNGLSWIVKPESAPSLTITVRVGGTTKLVYPINTNTSTGVALPTTLNGGSWTFGHAIVGNPTALTSGAVIDLTWTSTTAMYGKVTLFLSAEHV